MENTDTGVGCDDDDDDEDEAAEEDVVEESPNKSFSTILGVDVLVGAGFWSESKFINFSEFLRSVVSCWIAPLAATGVAAVVADDAEEDKAPDEILETFANTPPFWRGTTALSSEQSIHTETPLPLLLLLPLLTFTEVRNLKW